jgi:chromosome segregation ATPase
MRDKSKFDDISSPVPRWRIHGGLILISFTLGATGGIVFGHREGRSADKRELTEAQTRAQETSDKLRSVEANYSSLQTEQDKLKEQLAAVARERDVHLAATRVKKEAARARMAETTPKKPAADEVKVIVRP